MAHRLLLLLLADVSRSELEVAIDVPDEEVEAVYVVVPSSVGPLEWLATDEARAQTEAQTRALEAEWLLAGVETIGGQAGESDPVVAVGDALEAFAADEIVVVGHGEVDASLLEALGGFGLPVTLSGVWPGRRGRVRELVRSLRSGRSSATPLVAFAVANLGLLAIAVVASALVALIVWLLGYG